MNKKEKYFKCPNCNELTTQSEINDEISKMGGMGMCMCEFMSRDENGDIWFPRIYVPYKEISKEEYLKLRSNQTQSKQLVLA